jgi:hypothetical protein
MSKAKAKGTDAEVAVVEYLKSRGFRDVERRVTQGRNDRGDISVPGFPGGLVIEVKNQKAMDLSGWLKEAEQEALNADALYDAVWHKKIGKGSPGDWYVTMTGETFSTLLTVIELYGPRFPKL